MYSVVNQFLSNQKKKKRQKVDIFFYFRSDPEQDLDPCFHGTDPRRIKSKGGRERERRILRILQSLSILIGTREKKEREEEREKERDRER